MTINQFAEKYRLKVTKDLCGDAIIQGRLYKDANISEYNDGLCMCWLTGVRRKQKFNSILKECTDAGMTVVQEGDDEVIFLFDGSNDRQAKLAIQSVRARVKKTISPETKARLVAGLAMARNLAQKPCIAASPEV
jgi:GGDEF domain-containing protein